MIRSFFSFLLIFFVGFISNLSFASLPDEHNILIEVNETNESSYLNQAVQISVLKILGNHEILLKIKISLILFNQGITLQNLVLSIKKTRPFQK